MAIQRRKLDDIDSFPRLFRYAWGFSLAFSTTANNAFIGASPMPDISTFPDIET